MSRTILKIILVCCLGLVLAIFVLYRGQAWPRGIETAEVGVAAVVLAIFLLAISVPLRMWHDGTLDRWLGIGLLLGLLWTIEIGMNNVLQPGLPLRDRLDDVFWAAVWVGILILSLVTTWRTNTLWSGLRSGLWSGLGSGAVACLTGLILIVFGMPLLLHDPLNVAEWASQHTTSGTPGMAVYFAFQTLAGAILHLVLLGTIAGAVLGLIGGVVGKAFNWLFTQVRTPADMSH